MVGTDEAEKFRVWKTFGVVADGINRVGNAAAPDLLVVNLVIGFAGEGEAKKAQPFGRRRRSRARLERRLRRRDKKKPLDAGFLARRLRHEQVPKMHGVKGPAEQTDFLDCAQCFDDYGDKRLTTPVHAVEPFL